MKKFMIASLLVIAAAPAISHAGFLNTLQGSYSISGPNCDLGEVKITGEASILATQSGATVYIQINAGGLQTEIPVNFRNGSGDVKKTNLEGDILPLPVTRRTVWNTDEATRESVLTSYEGVAFAKKKEVDTLSVSSDGKILLKMQSSKSDITECVLIKE